VLLDLGTHLADQALRLFGKPDAITATVLCERAWASADDGFEIRLRYPGFTVALGANSLSLPSGPRFHLRGSRGNYWKYGLDPQEAALNQVTRITDLDWGLEPEENWGTLHEDVNGGTESRPIETLRGDYRRFYAALRDALLGKAPPPATAVEAWRTARLLEWAQESSSRRCEIACEWNEEPQ